MKIFMIAPQPFFQPRGTPYSILGRLRALSHLGHEVDLLTYHIGQDLTIPGVTIIRSPAIPFIRNISIGPSIVKLFLDVFLAIKAFRLLQKGHYDLLHTHEEACFFGLIFAKFFGLPHLYDMHSSLPQQLKNFRWGCLCPLVSLFAWLERRTVQSSDAVITICPDLEMHVWRMNWDVSHIMIENMASEAMPAIVADEELQSFKAMYEVGDKHKVILYTGNFESYQGIDLLIAAAERVLQQRQDALFVLVGGTPQQVQHYQQQVQDCGLLPYFRFAGLRPPDDMPYFMQLAHVLVSPRVSGTNTPLKIYNYLQSGKPIIATDLSTHTQVLSSDVAVLVASEPDALTQGILSVLDNPVLAKELGEKAQYLFKKRYSFSIFVQKTDQALRMALR